MTTQTSPAASAAAVSPDAVKCAARVREIIAAQPPASADRMMWYAEQLGALSVNADLLAFEIERLAGAR